MSENFDNELNELDNINNVYIQENEDAEIANDEIKKGNEQNLSREEIKEKIKLSIRRNRKQKKITNNDNLENPVVPSASEDPLDDELNSGENEKKRSIKDLTAEELDIYRDGIAAFKDFIEYVTEIKKRNKQYDALQTTMYICNAHRKITQKYSHVIEIMCHEGQFIPKFLFDYLIMIRNTKQKEKAVLDTMYDMFYIMHMDNKINAKKKKEIFHKFVENYREQDRKKKEIVDEATREADEIKRRNKEIYIKIIKDKLNINEKH